MGKIEELKKLIDDIKEPSEILALDRYLKEALAYEQKLDNKLLGRLKRR